MKIGVIIYSKDPETVWNAFRFAIYSMKQGDEVKIFLIASGVEAEHIDNEKFNVQEELDNFLKINGELFVCGTCLNKRGWDMPRFGKRASLAHLHEIVADGDRVVSF